MTTPHTPNTRALPGPGRFIPTADLIAVRQSPLNAMVTLARKYGDIFQYPVGFWNVVFVNHPDYIRHILQDNNKNYTKNTFQYNLLGSIAGRGLLTNDGESWLSQRRLAQPAFHRERLAALGAGMVADTERMLAGWETAARDGTPLDIDDQMMTLTMNVVGRSLFGVDLSGEAHDLVAAVVASLDHVMYRAMNPLALAVPERVPTPRNRKFAEARKRLDEAIAAIIARRRAHPGEHQDLLDTLMAAQDEETGARMTDTQLRDEIITLIIAGHETVASALTWAFYFLGKYPQVQRTLQAEVDTVLQGRAPTVADLSQLSYTRAVFEETLRFYPSAWIMTRRSLAADTIGEYTLPADSLVVISPYVTHRHPDFWEHPEGFDPERFVGDTPSRPRFAYFPFGGGPRLCIGNHYSYMEAQLVLASVAQRFTVSLVPGASVEVQPLVTLRPKGGVIMRVAGR